MHSPHTRKQGLEDGFMFLCLQEPKPGRNRKAKCGMSHKAISLILKKEGSFDTCQNTDEFWEHAAKPSQPVIKREIQSDSIYLGYLEE